MSKISTSDIQVTGSGKMRKELQPGNPVVRINSITFVKTPFNDNSWNLNLHMESEPLGDGFEGFRIDKDDESKGSYLGQCSRVRATTFPFKDGKVGNTVITRDMEILKWLKQFTDALGISKWLEDQDGKHDTVDGILEQLAEDKPFKDIWLNSCLAGKTYIQEAKDGSGQTYVKYDLYLPYFGPKGNPLEVKGTTPSKLLKFDEEVHIYKSKPKDPKKKSGADFEL